MLFGSYLPINKPKKKKQLLRVRVCLPFQACDLSYSLVLFEVSCSLDWCFFALKHLKNSLTSLQGLSRAFFSDRKLLIQSLMVDPHRKMKISNRIGSQKAQPSKNAPKYSNFNTEHIIFLECENSQLRRGLSMAKTPRIDGCVSLCFFQNK